jgi:non-canonical purine NTP pyrophosphatase (RdgB/HAM1 family)
LGEAKKLFLASGNGGKLKEFRAMAVGHALDLDLLPNFAQVPEFVETAPTFAENSAGKALYYSRHREGLVFADDSGLVVPALGGAPGVLSARYEGAGASDEERNAKLLRELRGKTGAERAAHFVCVITVAAGGRARVVVSGEVNGSIVEEARGAGGFGYDSVFYFPGLQKTFAELTAEEKNVHSHRGAAFRRMMDALE